MIFTDEQRAFAEALGDFAARECGTREQRDQLTSGGAEGHNQELYAALAKIGYVGVGIPEEYGGSGFGLVERCIFFEQLYRGMVPVAGAGPSSTVAGCYMQFGTELQRHNALAAIAQGSVMSISISEPGAGSDVANVSCRAERQHGYYVINGQKTWCSSAHIASNLLVLVRTSKDRHRGLTMVEVDPALDGIEIRRIDTMGGREVCDIFFTDCVIGEDKVVGEVGRGFQQTMAGLNGERLFCAAQGIGMAQRTMEDLLAYVTERQQFGRPIGTFQALRHRIADLVTEVECCRLITYNAAQRLDLGGDRGELTRLASMAKLKVTEVAKQVALEGMQMMGGYGYATEYDMERHVRDALVPPIYAGTNEIQREVIAATLGLRD